MDNGVILFNLIGVYALWKNRGDVDRTKCTWLVLSLQALFIAAFTLFGIDSVDPVIRYSIGATLDLIVIGMMGWVSNSVFSKDLQSISLLSACNNIFGIVLYSAGYPGEIYSTVLLFLLAFQLTRMIMVLRRDTYHNYIDKYFMTNYGRGT